MIECNDIELWDDWYLYYTYERIKKEIERRETKTKKETKGEERVRNDL